MKKKITISPDPCAAFSFYQKSSTFNYRRAFNRMGMCYNSGKGIEKNLEEAIQMYSRAMELGNPNAMYNIALIYQYNNKYRNLEEAIKFYKILIEINDADAMYQLALLYQENKQYNNLDEAIKLYKMAIELEKPGAMYQLGHCYYKGYGVEKKFDHAFKLFFQGSFYSHLPSIIQCFLFLSKGIGTHRYIPEAINFLKIAVDEHHFINGYMTFGLFLLKGMMIEKDEEKAVYYFQESSKNHDPEGKFYFGMCLIEGKGIKSSFYRGLELVRQSFESNLFVSELYLPLIEPSKWRYN